MVRKDDKVIDAIGRTVRSIEDLNADGIDDLIWRSSLDGNSRNWCYQPEEILLPIFPVVVSVPTQNI